MSLLGLLIPVGACAIKLMLRLNDPKPSDLADVIDDMSSLFGRTSDEYQRRKLIRQTEDMADSFAKHIADEVGSEYRLLSENDCAAAVAEVVAAVQSTLPISLESRLRVVSSVDPSSELYNVIDEASHVSRWDELHGESVGSFARLVLAEMCHATAAAFRRQPDLTVDMLAQLVRDSDSMRRTLESIGSALDQVPSRAAQEGFVRRSARVQEVTLEYTLEYLRSVASQLDQVGLYGLDLKWELRHYSLATSYITLRLDRSGSDRAAMSLDEALRSRIVYLRGPAGSGKSTILQWLAVGLARDSLPVEYRGIRGRVPLLIRLRDYSDEKLPSATELSQDLARYVLVQRPDAWMQVVAKQRGFVLLVDGVDEFPEHRTEELVAWLTSISDALPRTQVMVTGRPSADFAEHAIASAFPRRIRILDIQPMDRAEIRSFVLHWHKSTTSATGSDFHARDAMKVADALSGSRAYRLLAQTPLLCAALCALFYVRHGVLPSSRIETYETLIRVLLRARDDERGVTVDQIPELEIARFVLEQLAMFMISNNLSEMSTERAESCIRRTLERLPGGLDAKQVLQSLLRRSGIIREPAGGQVDFVHRTFLEYLAASAHLQVDSIEALGERADDPNWAEAVVLAASMANASQFASLVSLLLARSDNAVDRPPVWMTRIAAGILQTRFDLVDGPTNDLESILARSLPPTSDTEARAIVQAGDQMMPVLVASLFEGPVSDGVLRVPRTILAATIRALGADGGTEALDCLASLPPSLRVASIADLVSAWPAFDASEFAERVLGGIEPAHTTPVTLPTSRAFPLLRHLSKRFVWDAEIGYPDASFVADVSGLQLRSLSADHLDALPATSISGCDFLTDVDSVEFLSLRRCLDFSPAALTRHPERLRELTVVFSRGEFDITPLLASEALQQLTIGSFGRATIMGDPLRPIEINHKSLRSIRLAGDLYAIGVSFRVRDAVLTAAPAELVSTVVSDRLESIRLEKIEAPAVEYLACATSLREVDIVNCADVADLRPLLEISSLQKVRVSGPNLISNEPWLACLRERVSVVEIDLDPHALFGQAARL